VAQSCYEWVDVVTLWLDDDVWKRYEKLAEVPPGNIDKAILSADIKE
jgi:hypothetical protein